MIIMRRCSGRRGSRALCNHESWWCTTSAACPRAPRLLPRSPRWRATGRASRGGIEATLATATTAEWVERLAAASVAAGPIYEFDEVFEDPQVRHLGLVTEVEQPGYGPVRMLDFPFRATGTPTPVRRPAPRLGEHTAEVLAELGLAPAEIDRLAAAGAVALGG